MRIFSEKTNEEYKTVEECLAAEKEFDEKVAAEKAHKEKLANKRAERAAEIDRAWETLCEAEKKYRALVKDFVTDYGSYHKTYNTKDFPSDDIFDLFSSFRF